MKVGDRIRVFEVKPVGYYSNADTLIGKQRAEDVNSPRYGHEFGTDIISNDIWFCEDGNIHLGMDENRRHIKHVATMVITKLK